MKQLSLAFIFRGRQHQLELIQKFSFIFRIARLYFKAILLIPVFEGVSHIPPKKARDAMPLILHHML